MAVNVFTRRYSLDGGNGNELPTGGAMGDVLAKRTNVDYDVQWETPKDWAAEFVALTSAEIDAIVAEIE